MAEQEEKTTAFTDAGHTSPETTSTLEVTQDGRSSPPSDQPAQAVAEKPAGPGPPPDGGTKAWLQVVGGFLLVLNTWYDCNSSLPQQSSVSSAPKSLTLQLSGA